jgi:methyl-accepting chemotaxis protein
MNLQVVSAAEEQSAVSEEVNRNVSSIRDVTEVLARLSEDSGKRITGLSICWVFLCSIAKAVS